MHWGVELLQGGRARFRLWAPGDATPVLELDGAAPVPMVTTGDGWYEAEAEAEAGTRYRYRIGDLAVPDPASRAQADDVHGWSLVVDPGGYSWRATDWRGRPWREAVIMEVHVGAMGGFAGVAAHLPDFAAQGVTAVELMPVNAFSGTRNWGYDGVLPYAPAAAYGSPDDLKALVDRAHDLGLMILLDVVYNHFGPDGNYLPSYAPAFFHEEKHTPWGAAIAFDRTPVADFFIDNARMWIEEYRFDGLRFDAVHAIGDNGFLDRMAAGIRDGAGDRHVHLVLENESNDAERLRPGGYDAQWNDDFHNVLHPMLTGERDAYYGDFVGEAEAKLARCLSQGFIYQGEPSDNLGEPRGKPSGHLPPTAFVSFLQNHDQVGNRALGERLTTLVARDRLRAAVALQLLCPQIPLLFMGEEAGSETPFLFFTDFHNELADAVREGRRKEFAKFAAFQSEDAREKIPDPNARGTFEASVPLPGRDAEDWRAFYRRLIALRFEQIVPHLDGTRSDGAEPLGACAVQARWRLGDGRLLMLALNLSDDPVDVVAPETPPLLTVGEGLADGRLRPASLVAWLA